MRDVPLPPPGRHRPAIRPNLTLALLSAALTAALFLLVLLLVDGWQRSPATAAVTVSVVAIAALGAGPLARLLDPPHPVEVGVGCFLVAGGLAGLALLPSAHLVWTVAPQALVGLGLGLTVDQLTAQAMRLRVPRVEHAGWTIGARHLGVVVGLALLTPVFTADLQDAQVPAQEAITSLVLDAPLPAEDKVELAQSLGDLLADQQGQIPDLHEAFAATTFAPADQAAADRLESDLDEQLERAATRAFRDSFLVGAGLALLALLTVVVPGSPGSPEAGVSARVVALPALALALVAAVLGVQIASGGGTFEPLQPADPCAARSVTSQSDGIDGLTEQLVLRGLDNAACTLGDSREALTLELARPGTRTDAQVDALRQGLLDAVDEMDADGTLPPASDLVDDALDQADLNPIVESLVRAVPDSVIDAALKTDDVLTRAIEDLDLEQLLGNLSDPDELDTQVQAAVTQAVKDSLVARLQSLV